jgi:hypothetical protein
MGRLTTSFIGDPHLVPDVSATQVDSLMVDPYTVWGYRYQTASWVSDDADLDEMDFGDEWDAWDTSSTSVLLVSSLGDDEFLEPDVIRLPLIRSPVRSHAGHRSSAPIG